MFGSMLKIVLSPVDILVSAAIDVVDVATLRDDVEFGENTGSAVSRLGENLSDTFKPESE